jgi:uncharacterized protein
VIAALEKAPVSPELHIALWLASTALVALLYACVGHAGASGYIAVMTLLAVAPQTVKPSALALNILVASIGSWQFARAGHFSWRLLWPFAVPAVPMAYLGGWLHLSIPVFNGLVGATLLFCAWRFLTAPQDPLSVQPPPVVWAIVCGAVMGLLAGLSGTGGGIFLTPLLLLMRWARAKTAAAVSAVFILLNSVAGLSGALSSAQDMPPQMPWLLLAAGLGGSIGSYFGSQNLSNPTIKRVLALVLMIAGLKLLFSLTQR